MLILTFDDDSLILIDYTAKIKDDGTVFDTTSKSIAKDNSIYDPNKRYTPTLVSINNIAYPQRAIINDTLAQSNVGDNLTIEISPKDAFGERDSSKIRAIPLRKLGDIADRVSVGDNIKVGEKEGLVKLISSGRVRIDFNHKFAGKIAIYDITIIKLLDTPELKIKGIINEVFSTDDESINFTLDNNTLIINVPSLLLFNNDLTRMKNNIQSDIFSFIPTIQSIMFTDTYINEFSQKDTFDTSSNISPTSEPHTMSDEASTSDSQLSEPTIPESSVDTSSESPTNVYESESSTGSSIVEPDSESNFGSLDEAKF